MIDNRAVRNVSLLSVCQALAQTQMVLIFFSDHIYRRGNGADDRSDLH